MKPDEPLLNSSLPQAALLWNRSRVRLYGQDKSSAKDCSVLLPLTCKVQALLGNLVANSLDTSTSLPDPSVHQWWRRRQMTKFLFASVSSCEWEWQWLPLPQRIFRMERVSLCKVSTLHVLSPVVKYSTCMGEIISYFAIFARKKIHVKFIEGPTTPLNMSFA